jgi:membrane protease subunit (stomatin/prohibitin family)
MGWFSKNLTLKILEWEDNTSDTIVHKFPMDGRKIFFGSKLTVRESQAAVFLNKGEIADVFEPGMYTLRSSNLPIISNILGLPYGFKSPFFADVYFVNTKQFTNQKWGTTNPITLRDKDFGTIRLRAYGTYSFKVSDPATFLRQLFGTNSTFTTEDITGSLRSMLISCISDTIAESKISALDLASNLLEFNKQVVKTVADHFSTLGLTVTNCVIENISFPEAVEKAIDTRSSLGILDDSMDTYVKYQSAEALRDAAKNPGVSGLGTQIGAGVALGSILKESLSTPSQKTTTTQPKADDEGTKACPKCGEMNKKSDKFCFNCGEKLPAKSDKFCPQCGNKIQAKDKFCGECGTKLN